MIPDSLVPVANHLWQSTVFAGAAALLIRALRKSPARVRSGVWISASLKFLIPFSVLITLGSHIHWRATAAPAPMLSSALDQATQPFVVVPSAPTLAPVAATSANTLLLSIAWALWACGFIAVAGSWLIRWRRIAAAVRTGSPVDLGLPIPAIYSRSFTGPGVFGVFRPVLLLPEGILERLTPAQWRAVAAHELCHARRGDNFFALVQMLVEAAFWFHPLTWWIGKQVSAEQELACDEEVLRLGNEPRAYAGGILKICEVYLETPAPCIAGISGSNLKTRIEAILNGRIVRNLNAATKALLAAAACLAVGAPVAIGLLHGVNLRAQTVPSTLRFEVASVKAGVPDPRRPGFRVTGVPGPGDTDPGRFTAHHNLLSLVLIAYDIPLYRLSDPDDRLTTLVDVEAKMPPGTTREQFNVMLQNLLADRFALKVHWATQPIDMYALLLGKGGPKLRPAAPDAPQTGDTAANNGPPPRRVGSDGYPLPPPGNGFWIGGAPGGKMGLRGHNETAAELAHTIGMRTLDGPLTDSTGLTGKYDYTLFWSTPATTAALGINPAVEPDGPSVFDAVQDQLGLKIEKRKVPAQILVIDHAEKKPLEN